MSEHEPRDSSSRLPVVTGPVKAASVGRASTDATGAFDAQLLGQGGVRRGLRGGAPVLEAAQQVYLETEWSGPSDRRTPSGTTRREKV